jgi:hypothetical protein
MFATKAFLCFLSLGRNVVFVRKPRLLFEVFNRDSKQASMNYLIEVEEGGGQKYWRKQYRWQKQRRQPGDPGSHPGPDCSFFTSISVVHLKVVAPCFARDR